MSSTAAVEREEIPKMVLLNSYVLAFIDKIKTEEKLS